jgi:peptidoglycan hydrolase-like protein with peptidoglycan-binding domain
MTVYDGAKVIGLAQNEINTLRGPHEDNEFGRELGLNNVFWCSVFVSAMMKRAGFTSLYPVTASTRVSYAFYRKQHWIVPKMDGRPGDIAWMFFAGRIGPVNHIGLVTGVHGDGSVSVIDGNSGGPAGVDGVFRHKYHNAVVALGRPGGRGPVDVPGPPPFPGRTLSSGDRGEDVTVVQRNLNRFMTVDIPVTGVFDAATTRALTKWQRNRLVPAASLGTVGVGTWSMLAAPVFTGTLAQGSNGKAVQQLKRALNKFGNDLTVTNPSFGPETRHVVETWQKHRGQRVDGRVDMPTWYWMHIAMPANQIHVPNLHP